MALDIVIVFLVQGVEWKTIREYIYKFFSQWKFTIERRKGREIFITPIIHVN